jgi:hypothetical protein
MPLSMADVRVGGADMRESLVGTALVALLLPSAFQALDMRAACAQQATPQQLEQVEVQGQAGCDNHLASVPGEGGKEYDLFKNVMARSRGCTSSSPVAYEKVEERPVPGKSRAVPPLQAVSPQQEEMDRAACRAEGEQAAHAGAGLRPGEYDIFKSNFGSRSGDVERVEQSCMAQRGYRSVAN